MFYQQMNAFRKSISTVLTVEGKPLITERGSNHFTLRTPEGDTAPLFSLSVFSPTDYLSAYMDYKFENVFVNYQNSQLQHSIKTTKADRLVDELENWYLKILEESEKQNRVVDPAKFIGYSLFVASDPKLHKKKFSRRRLNALSHPDIPYELGGKFLRVGKETLELKELHGIPASFLEALYA